MKKRLITLLGCLAVMLAGGTCSVQAQDYGDVPTDFTMNSAPYRARERSLWLEAEQLLKTGQYGTIEQRLARYRRPGETLIDGKDKLIVFYYGVGWGIGVQTESDWQKSESRLRQWRKQYPASIGPVVALAMHYNGGASMIVGEKDLKTLTPAQRKRREQRLAMAQKALDAGKTMRERCPAWYFLAQNIGLSRGISLATFNDITDKGNAEFAHFLSYEYRRIQYMASSHYKGTSNWQLQAARVADRLKGEAGDQFYARIVWSLLSIDNSATNPALKKFDWPRAKRGFEALMSGSDTDSIVGAFAVAAWRARDRTTLRNLFENYIGNNADPYVWADYAQYTAAREWAFAEG